MKSKTTPLLFNFFFNFETRKRNSLENNEKKKLLLDHISSIKKMIFLSKHDKLNKSGYVWYFSYVVDLFLE
jgi:hypothetical protein